MVTERSTGARILWAVLSIMWMGCFNAWILGWILGWDDRHGPDDRFLQGAMMGFMMGVAMPWLSGRMSRGDKDAGELLTPEDRAVVEEALRTGEPKGRLVLRVAERDAARQRLAEHPPSRTVQCWLAVGLVAPYVGMAFAPDRPVPLVAVTVATTIGAVALLVRLWGGRRPDLPDDERARLRALARQSL